MNDYSLPPIRLINITPEVASSIIDNPDEFSEQFGAIIGENKNLITRLVRESMAFIPAGANPRWYGYFAADASTRQIIGVCSFKGPPALPDYAVEIAYFTFPLFEGNGYATAMAAELIGIANGTDPAITVFAHTLPEENASTRVLRKVGMTLEGEFTDSADGPLWIWSFKKSIA